MSRKLAYRIRVKPFLNGATLSVKDPFSKLEILLDPQVISEVRRMSLHNSMQPYLLLKYYFPLDYPRKISENMNWCKQSAN